MKKMWALLLVVFLMATVAISCGQKEEAPKTDMPMDQGMQQPAPAPEMPADTAAVPAPEGAVPQGQ